MWDSEQTTPLLNEGKNKKLEHDPTFKGITEHGRKFNDILFGILFLIVVVAFGAISIVGFKQGNPSVLIPSSQYVIPVEDKGQYWFQDGVAQLKQDRDILGGALGIALLTAMIWITLMKYFTKFFIYMTVVSGVLIVAAVGIYVLVLGIRQDNQNLRITSYCLFAISGFLCLVVFFLRSKISLTAALFKECCQGVQYNPAIFVVGTIVLTIFSAFAVFWVAQFIYLYSIPADTQVQINSHIPVQFNQSIRNLMYFQVFAFFWISALISAIFQYSVAGAIASWYFSRDPSGFSKDVGSPALRSFGRALTKSFGSLAFGALLLAVVQFLNFLVKQSKKYADRNRLTRILLGCVVCCLSCIEGFIQKVDRFTYIHMAMHGGSFLTSAKTAFELISRNSFSLVVVDFLGDFVLFVGKLLGTGVTTFATIALLHGLARPITGVTISVVVVCSYFIFHIISHVIGVGVDTVFVCYMEDLERNKEQGLYMNQDLHRMLQTKAKKNQTIVN